MKKILITITVIMLALTASINAAEAPNIQELYSSAQPAAGWFTIDSDFNRDESDLSHKADFEVPDKIEITAKGRDEPLEAICIYVTKSEMREYLLTFFTLEKADIFLDGEFVYGSPKYVEQNGVLYMVTGFQRGWSGTIKNAEGKITSSTEEKIVYTVTADLYYGNEYLKKVSYDNVLIKNADGEWVFDDILYEAEFWDQVLNPDTSDASIICMSAAALLSAVGAAYVMKKRRAA